MDKEKSKKKKVTIIVIVVLCVAAVIGFVITKIVTTPKVEIDYGTSDIYTQKDMDEAIKVIKRKIRHRQRRVQQAQARIREQVLIWVLQQEQTPEQEQMVQMMMSSMQISKRFNLENK